MLRFVLSRLVQSLVALAILSVVVFVLARATGDPLHLILPMSASEEDYAYARRYLGLDRPYVEQYFSFVGKAVMGDFGTSLRARRPVSELIRERLPNSLRLALFAMCVSLSFAFPLGVLAAVKKGTWIDRTAQVIAVLGQSLPTFWVAIVLVEFVAGRLQCLPAGGISGFASYILPGFTLGWFVVAGMMRLLRSGMLEVLDSEYVKLARVKGVVERRVVWLHALKNALIPVVTFAGIYFAILVTTAIVAPLISPADPEEQSLRHRFRPPVWDERGSWQHPLGTDRLGRDMLSRIFYGSRVSLTAGVVTVLLASAFGAAVGLVAGYYGGRVDAVLMRLTDATMSFPVILLALILAVTVGPSFANVVVAIAVILWARYARVIRGQVLTLMELDFIAQARIAGAGAWRVISRHLLPNTLNTLVVLVTLQIGYVIIVEASLSFLGAGIPPPTPAWGSMIAEGREFVTSAWWVSFFPGLAILLVVLAFNLLGDWLRDTLDPKLRQL